MKHEEVLGAFADSVQELLGKIADEMEMRKLNHDDDETTLTFYTQKHIREWFRTNGGLGT